MPRSVKDIAIIILLIGGGLLILFWPTKSQEGGPVARAIYTVVGPLQQASTAAYRQVTGVWNGYVNLIHVRQENERLREEVKGLKRERGALLNAEMENRRLKKLLNLKARNEFPFLVAQVIAEDAVGWYRTFFINRGSEDGVLPEMPVTVAEGVVGRIVKNAPEVSQVLLITDPNLSIDCRITRTRDRGVLTGSLDGACVLRYINLESGVGAGDEVVTSGLDGMFPRGLPVGKIASVGKSSQGLFLEARVTPHVNFSGIEEVLVILANTAGFDLKPGLDEKR
ncbi:MAG: rod shape-determining protein MreC [Desulfomonile tiedjei]|nr:rod shape-determining protein MreC [Desulfomonile tiedjei]